MWAKIIEIKDCKTCKELLVFITYEENEEIIHLLAHHHYENGDYNQDQTIRFGYQPTTAFLQNFVTDFSFETALEFVNSMEF